MKTLLRIDSSARKINSHSRTIADLFENLWRKNNTACKVIYRDLAERPVSHISNKTIEGFYTETDQLTEEQIAVTSVSDELIAEVKAADEILISSPLYNYNIPSTLKAYIDHVVRVNHTFYVDKHGEYKGLLENKKAYIITAKGSIYRGTEYEVNDFQEPYLKAVLELIGIKDIKIFSLEGTSEKEMYPKEKSKIEEAIFNHFKTNCMDVCYDTK